MKVRPAYRDCCWSVGLACGALVLGSACTGGDDDDTGDPSTEESGGVGAAGALSGSGGMPSTGAAYPGGYAGSMGGNPNLPTGTGATTSGGSAGSGGSGGSGTGGTEEPPPLQECDEEAVGVSATSIDDFEDGDKNILALENREGTWYTYQDETEGGGEVSAETVAGEGRGGGYALKFSSTGGYTEWGAGVGTDLYPINFNCAYDASVFGGIGVCLRGTVDAEVYLQLSIPATIPTDASGMCVAGDDCYNAPVAPKVALTSEWACHEFQWEDFGHPGWGVEYEWDPTAIAKLELRIDQESADQAFEVFIDDVAFLGGSGGGAGGAGGATGAAGGPATGGQAAGGQAAGGQAAGGGAGSPAAGGSTTGGANGGGGAAGDAGSGGVTGVAGSADVAGSAGAITAGAGGAAGSLGSPAGAGGVVGAAGGGGVTGTG